MGIASMIGRAMRVSATTSAALGQMTAPQQLTFAAGGPRSSSSRRRKRAKASARIAPKRASARRAKRGSAKRFAKGSPAAKRHMAKLRRMRRRK